jgi:hypothetical protein
MEKAHASGSNIQMTDVMLGESPRARFQYPSGRRRFFVVCSMNDEEDDFDN